MKYNTLINLLLAFKSNTFILTHFRESLWQNDFRIQMAKMLKFKVFFFFFLFHIKNQADYSRCL